MITLLFSVSYPLLGSSPQEKMSAAKKMQRKPKGPRQIPKAVAQTDDSAYELPVDAQLIDKVIAVIYAQEGVQIITQSDLKKPSLDGRIRNLDDIILESLMYLDAQRYKINADEEMIDKHLAALQRENNLTLAELNHIFANAGYTPEEGRKQFGMVSVVNQLLDFKIRSRLIIPEKEVVAYYNENPERQEAAYMIERGVIGYSNTKDKESQKQDIEDFVARDQGLVSIKWQEPFWVNESDMADNKKFIMTMKVGDISMPESAADGFEVFQLKEKREATTRSLQDRYREISDLLRKPKYEQLLEAYKKQLFETASIVYFD